MFLVFWFLVGVRCLGIGLGNLDGWDGDYSIHLLPAGPLFFFNYEFSLDKNIYLRGYPSEIFYCSTVWSFNHHNMILWWPDLFIFFPIPGWKSSVDACFSWDYLWSWTNPYVASGPSCSISYSLLYYVLLDILAWSLFEFLCRELIISRKFNMPMG